MPTEEHSGYDMLFLLANAISWYVHGANAA